VGLGIGMFVLMYYMTSILATPLYDTRINPSRFPLFFYLVLLLLIPSLASSLLTFDGIQSKFKTRHFQDVWVTLAIGIAGRGIIIGALVILRTMYLDSIVFFIVFMAADLFFSLVSFHYFRSALQEAIFNSLLLAWVFTCLGYILVL
jgi:hypothetical protein